jgi:aryl-alcohol dehydrogenase-like predicted oxidoreductase
MQQRRLGSQGPLTSAIGFGAMGLSGVYGAAQDAESEKLLRRALDLGVSLIDTANVYGGGHNEKLVGRALADRRAEIVLATKFGADADSGAGSRQAVHRAFAASARRLGVDFVDLYYLHRVDPVTAIEESVGAMAELVRAGKVGHLGLSEVAPETLRRAYAVHPIAAVQTEYSLFSRDPEGGILPVARELGAALVAYSPLGRGMLGGRLRGPEDLPADDWRRSLPRFQAGTSTATWSWWPPSSA